MQTGWNSTKLKSTELVLAKLESLLNAGWIFRGQSELFNNLNPSFERHVLLGKARFKMLSIERECINIFRANVKSFCGRGEESSLSNDLIALMVLRHYGAPSRLLDWSSSPWVATYFAVQDHDESDAEIWTFDHTVYALNGKEQWRRYPETTTDGSGDPDKFDYNLTTAFLPEYPHDWFVLMFYKSEFPRQNAQKAAYSMTPQFGVDHADALRNLLKDPSYFHRYIIPANLKPSLRQTLKDNYEIWRGPLFPDSSGATETAKTLVFNK